MQYGIQVQGNEERKFAVEMSQGRIYTVGELLYDEQNVRIAFEQFQNVLP